MQKKDRRSLGKLGVTVVTPHEDQSVRLHALLGDSIASMLKQLYIVIAQQINSVAAVRSLLSALCTCTAVANLASTAELSLGPAHHSFP